MCAPAVLRVDAHTGFVHPAIALGTEPLVANPNPNPHPSPSP